MGLALMDRVHALAKIIAQMQPAEKQELFRLLAAQGEVPPTRGSTSQERNALAPGTTAAQGDRQPDYIVVFDGGSRGNPGWGYGSFSIVRVQDGAQRLKRLDLGHGYTSNEAEYDTLVAALKYLLERIEESGRRAEQFALEVRGDSSLVINQLSGKWRAKEPRMKERRDLCLGLLEQFGSVELKTQPREESVRVLGH
jgi:ribonuclease HI